MILSKRVTRDSHPVPLRVANVDRVLRARFNGEPGRGERFFEREALSRLGRQGQEKRAGTDALHPAGGLQRALDHQDRPAEIDPDRSQPSVRFEAPAHLPQAEQVAVKCRDALDVACAEGQVVKFSLQGILPIQSPNCFDPMAALCHHRPADIQTHRRDSGFRWCRQ